MLGSGYCLCEVLYILPVPVQASSSYSSFLLPPRNMTVDQLTMQNESTATLTNSYLG